MNDQQPSSIIASIRCGVNRLLAIFRKTSLDRDLSEELDAHLEFAIEENIRRGLSKEEARRQAMIQLGGIMRVKELHREARGLPGSLPSFD